MGYSTAIVIAAGLLAGAVMLSGRADSQSPAAGRYVGVGVADSGTAAWKLDSATGEMSYCTYASGAGVSCRGAKP